MRNQILSIWKICDPFYYFCSRLTYVTTNGDNIFRIRLTKYKGRNITLSDGTQILKNDTLVKIHLHNIRLLMEVKDIKSELKKAKLIYRYVQNSLPGVENFIRNHHKTSDIKGIVGITSLSKGTERLGFEIIDIMNPFYKWYKKLSFLPIGLLSNKGTSVNQILKVESPIYLFMSKDKLSQIYGQKDNFQR
ncbi:hypothetical protein EKG37_11960 [Robertmurraya yapensis]|uniref:YkoP-like domain-containing protein n=2 Tax=Bacillaceae TaxID=186817 RepID=A0A431W6G7_9BACI|nr:hypothetical protein [Bacillus yapensis]RTR31013.1 hypothetical protein EKG37_11960 [Bacillus yapensis]TKS95442.1 hypothetical protein FAR12_11960 [Bacillus yapensis]